MPRAGGAPVLSEAQLWEDLAVWTAVVALGCLEALAISYLAVWLARRRRAGA